MKKITILSILLMIISVGLFCGCTEEGTVVISISELKNNPEDYLDKEVTIKGALSFLYNFSKDCTVKDDTGTIVALLDGIQLPILAHHDEEFYVSGTFKYDYFLDLPNKEYYILETEMLSSER